MIKTNLKTAVLFVTMVALMPATTWAQELTWTEVSTKEALNTAITNGAHIRLTADITLSEYLTIGQNNVTQVVTIDLNGHTLGRTGLTAPDANGHVIEVFGVGDLTLTSSVVGGTLTGGWANNGGGICNYGTVTINDNVTITGCRAKEGGGIKNNSGSTLNINGGSITGNIASSTGGGIWSDGTMNIQGEIIAIGNTLENGATQNVYLKSGKVMNVTGAFTGDTNIGVTLETTSGTFTSGYSNYHSGTELSNYFLSDVSVINIVSSDNEAALLISENTVYYIRRGWDEENKVVTMEECVKGAGEYNELSGDASEDYFSMTNGGWYVVKGSAVKRKRIIVPQAGVVHLIICDGAKLSSVINFQSDNKNAGTIHIYGQASGTGLLDADATRGDYELVNAGIGGTQCNMYEGHWYEDGGNVYIHGGTIRAKGERWGAGIGTGHTFGSAGTLVVYAGDVEARGGSYAAGIGGGQEDGGADVTIYGGNVWAYGGTDAAGIGSGEEIRDDTDGGSLTVWGGTVFADGSGWGAGIGGGEDSDGANVVINGGIVMAWAGDDAGEKNGCAIGSENGDGHRGSLHIGDNMMVHAGQNPTDANAHLFPYDTRVPACFFRPYARIEPCNHQGATYTINGTDVDGTHTLHCTHCRLSPTETHTFNDDGECTVCHVHASVSTVRVYMPVHNSELDTYSYGDDPTYSEQLVTNSTFELPAASPAYLPAGVRFVGWRIGSPSELNLSDPRVTENEPGILPAGSMYTVTGDVSLTPRYKTFHVFTTAGNWNTASNWCWNEVPTSDHEMVIAAAATIPEGYTAEAGNLTIDLGGSITIADGGQFIHSNEGVTAMVEKHIAGYGTSDGGYHLIANPVQEALAPANLGMTTGNYDLYWFDQSQELEWQNYKQNSFDLENGTGYLYANSANNDIAFNGVLNRANADISVPVTHDADAEFPGFNLVGNPFVCDAYLADGRDFYVLDANGGEIVTSISNAIAPMQGVFVQTSANENTVSFTTTAPTQGKALDMSVSHDRGTVIDNARIRFGEGHGLEKFQLDPSHSKLYIPQDGKDYAVVHTEAEGELPVSFKAEKNGTYTLTISEGIVIASEAKPSNLTGFSYLHLIDNLTGADIDLLQTPSYTFESKVTDYESRFKLVFSAKDEDGPSTDSGTFAFFNGSEWQISNEGKATLQVIDVMGRVLSTETISGNAEVSIHQPAGIYMLRLVNGDDVKTQKIVVQ